MSTPSSAHPSSSRRPSYGTEPSSRPSPITPRRAALLFLSFTTLTLALLLLPAALRHQSSGGDDGGVPQLPGMQRGLSLAEGAGWMTGETARPTEWELLASTTGRGGDALAVGTTSILDTLSRSVEASVDRIGDTILAWLGLDEATEAGASGNGGSLAAWGESSVYVERTNSLHPSRPSSFGPHIVDEPLRAPLFPITTFASSDSYGCEHSATPNNSLPTPPERWIAISQRGHCPFSQKVRFAQELGATALLFGDQSAEEGGIGGSGGLLTPWSPDDTSDITIPSAFVSRASYLSLLRTWKEEQDLEEDEPIPVNAPALPCGLMIVMSQDELFAWPLLDFLLLLLFLPSLLTLLTVFTQRIRLRHQQKLDRAPRDAVAKLPVFIWGDTEKSPDVHEVIQPQPEDEERNVGVVHPVAEEPNESTSLLPTSPGEAGRSAFSWHVPEFIRRASGTPTVHLAPRRKHKWHTVECAICLSDFERGDKVMELPCGHLFHAEEIEPWLLESKRLCPTCRASITEEPSAPSSPPQAPVHHHQHHHSTPPTSTTDPTPPVPLPLAIVAQERAANSASPVASSSSITIENAAWQDAAQE